MTFTQKVKQIILLIFGLSVAHLGVTFFIQANLGTDPFNVLVQGMIDAYFIEDEEMVLVDYKTDFVRRGEEQKLIDRYHVQLEDYAQALERMTGRKVKERYIYSFTFGEAFSL